MASLFIKYVIVFLPLASQKPNHLIALLAGLITWDCTVTVYSLLFPFFLRVRQYTNSIFPMIKVSFRPTTTILIPATSLSNNLAFLYHELDETEI